VQIHDLKAPIASIQYSLLAEVFETIEQISGRLEIIEIVRELFLKLIECCPDVSGSQLTLS